MAGQLTRICGLWSKDTNRGTVISCSLKPEARQALLDALANPDELYELVLFQNTKGDKPTSPTHNLCIGVGRARMPQEARAPEPAPAHAETPVRGKAWRGEAGTSPKSADEDFDAPF